MKQDSLSELIAQGLIKTVLITEAAPSKGRTLSAATPKKVWTVTVVLINGSESQLLSTRGTPREWASLDRLAEWLRSLGLSNYQINQMEIGA